MDAFGVLYGVGVGPGDPELVTKKAERVLRECDIVAVPDKGSGNKTAYGIVKDLIAEKEILFCDTPMIRDKETLDKGYTAIAERICELLKQGKTVAFITLGDPTVYSTYIYVHKKVLDRGFIAELVPGIPSFCAAAARLNMSLCEGAQRLLIVPASYDVDDCKNVSANKVYMKAGKDMPELREQLRQTGQLRNASVVENCGLPGERIWTNMEEIDEAPGYFSLVIVKEGQN